MRPIRGTLGIAVTAIGVGLAAGTTRPEPVRAAPTVTGLYVNRAVKNDIGNRITDNDLGFRFSEDRQKRNPRSSFQQRGQAPIVPPVITVPPDRRPSSRNLKARSLRPSSWRASMGSASASKDRRAVDPGAAAAIRPTTPRRRPDHIVQIVNSRIAIFTKKGKQFDTTGKVLYGPVRHQQRVQGLRRDVRGAQQRRRRRALRSARGPLAHRDAALLRAAARPDQPAVLARRTSRARQPDRRRGTARQGVRCSYRRRRRHRHRRRRPAARPRSAGQPRRSRRRRRTPAPYSMCYAVSTSRTHSARTTATNSCARSSPITRGRRSGPTATTSRPARATTGSRDGRDAEARVRRRSRAMLEGRARDRTVHHRRQRELPQQRGHRRQGAATDGRAEHHDRRRRHAARQDVGRQRRQRLAVPRRLEGSVEDEDRRAGRRSKSRRITICAAGSSPTACRSRARDRRLDAQGDKIMARLVYRRLGESRVDRRHALGQHRRPAAAACAGTSSGSTRDRNVSLHQQGTYAPTASIAGWPARRSTSSATSASATRSAARRTSPASVSPAGCRTIRSGSSRSRDDPRRGRGRADQHAALGGLHQTAVDPSDDCTIWYVGDYFKKDATSYSTKIGGFKMPGCR